MNYVLNSGKNEEKAFFMKGLGLPLVLKNQVVKVARKGSTAKQVIDSEVGITLMD
jgi:hypothetical protein